MAHNPYAPPRAEVGAPAETADAVELASGWRRFVNMLIDALGFYVLAIVVGVLLSFVDQSLLDAMTMYPLAYLFGLAVMILYYVPSETLFGRTLGKLVTGTRTVSESGAPASFLQILGRTLSRLIPFELLTFVSKPHVGLHDRLSHTRVIRIRG